MAIEIERKFLVASLEGIKFEKSLKIRQAYLFAESSKTLRIRITGDEAKLNIKSGKEALRRLEYEYRIPLKDAEEMFQEVDLVGNIEKTRHLFQDSGCTWEVDEFHGDNSGLIVAEIELANETQSFQKPEWVGKEVTEESKYLNSQLSRNPFKNWRS